MKKLLEWGQVFLLFVLSVAFSVGIVVGFAYGAGLLVRVFRWGAGW